MKPKVLIPVAVALLAALALVSVRVWRSTNTSAESTSPASGPGQAPVAKVLPAAKAFKAPAGAEAAGGLSADQAARIEKIRRDYEEIRTKMSADFSAAGDKFPGGLNAFLKQLALLEREMHADFAAALTPRELEDYEMKESMTGQAVQLRLAGATVTDEQRRAVYRIQREFDDRFALVFDVSPVALAERTKVLQVAREKIRATLGDEVFAEWMRTEDPSFAAMRTLAAQQDLPVATVAELWRIKNEFVQGRLEIAAQPGLTAAQRAAMVAALGDQTRSRVTVLVRPEALVPGSEALGWLPPGR